MEFKVGEWVVIEGYEKYFLYGRPYPVDGALCTVCDSSSGMYQLEIVKSPTTVMNGRLIWLAKKFVKEAPIESEAVGDAIDLALAWKDENWFMELVGGVRG